MAIFKCPKITTEQRLQLILQESELVYDLDQKIYYGGDSVRLGGFPLGEPVLPKIEIRVITQGEIDQGFLILDSNVSAPSLTRLHFINGTTQLFDIDYTIEEGFNLVWEGYSLEGFIEAGDVVRVEYF